MNCGHSLLDMDRCPTCLQQDLDKALLQIREMERSHGVILETIRGHMTVQDNKLEFANRLNRELTEDLSMKAFLAARKLPGITDAMAYAVRDAVLGATEKRKCASYSSITNGTQCVLMENHNGNHTDGRHLQWPD